MLGQSSASRALPARKTRVRLGRGGNSPAPRRGHSLWLHRPDLSSGPWFGSPLLASRSAPRFGSPLGPRSVVPRSAPGSVPAARPPARFPTLGSALGFRFGSSLSAPRSVPRSAPCSVLARLPVRFLTLGSQISSPLGPGSVLAWLPPYSIFLHLRRLRFGVCLLGRGHFLRPSRRRHMLPWQPSPGKPARSRASTGAGRAPKGLSRQCCGAGRPTELHTPTGREKAKRAAPGLPAMESRSSVRAASALNH